MTSTLAAGAAALLASVGISRATTGSSLSWRHFPAGGTGFFRAPVLVSGVDDAVLIDGGFTYPDGRAVAEAIKATGRTLTTIYISQSDPDYYFGLKPITEMFPNTNVIAAPQTVAAINGNVAKKLATWGPQLKENGPQTLADIVMPQVFDGRTLRVGTETIDIVDAEGLANRRYLFVPSLNAVVGGVMIFSGVHVWTADTPTREQRVAWIRNLEAITARKPAVVVPGHMAVDAKTDLSAVDHTIAYLTAFEEELAANTTSAAVKSAMEARFPGLGMGVALDIGAKVATGEMPWG